MATSLQNKINDLEARLKAENEARTRERVPRDFTLPTGSPRRPKACENFYVILKRQIDLYYECI